MEKDNTPFKFHLADWFLASLFGLASLGVYIRTLAPGVLLGDSAEFQVLAYQLGIAHCPGYPIYLVLAKVFTFLPLGDIAYRVNLFSAFMAALAVSGLYLTAYIITANRWASTFAALVFAVSYTLWSQAVIAEVYTTAAAFAIFILCCVIGWGKTGKGRLLFLAGLLGGLSLGVHTMVVLLAPAILVYLWQHRKEHSNFWKPAIAGAILGVLLWGIIFFLIDLNAPPANIFNGAYATARSVWDLSQEDIQKPWVRIWFLASGRQWRSALDFNFGAMLGQAGSYFYHLPREFSYLTLFLVIVGLIDLGRRHSKIPSRTSSLLWLSLLFQWLVSFNYRIGDIYVFYILGYLVLALAAALGLVGFIRWLHKFRPGWNHNLLTLISLIIIIFSVGQMVYPRLQAIQEGVVPFIGDPDFLFGEDPAPLARIAYRTVEQMKPDSIVFLDWNSLYIYYYVAHIEQNRTDLRFIEPSPRADTPGLPDSVIDFIEAKIDSQPIYFSYPFREVETAGFRFRRVQIWYTTFHQVVRP